MHQLTALNPKVSKMEIGSGGLPSDFTQQVAGALRGITGDQFNLLYLKYANTYDISTLKELCHSTAKNHTGFYTLYGAVASLAAREAWKIREPRQDKLRRLLNLCIVEYLDVACPTCKGLKETRTNEPCPSCRRTKESASTGRWTISDRQKAAIMEVNHKTYLDTWKQRQYMVAQLVNDFAREGEHKFRAQFYG